MTQRRPPGSVRLRPMRSAYRRPQARPGGRRSTSTRWRGWIAAAAGIGAIAFIVGRAGLDVGLSGATPIPSAVGPAHVVFGTGLDPSTGKATGAIDRFRAGDAMAYSVELPPAADAGTVFIEVVRLDGSIETVKLEPTETVPQVVGSIIGFRPDPAAMLTAWGPGSYLLRIYLDPAGAPVAIGPFTLVESPVAS